MAVGMAAKLLRDLNRALRKGTVRAGARKGAVRKVKRAGKQIKVRVDNIPSVQAALREAGPGAKIISAQMVGIEAGATRTVPQMVRVLSRKPEYRFLKETPVSAKGRLRKSVYNEWYARQVILAKQYADRMRAALRTKLGKAPTRAQLQNALREKPFVSEPMPLAGNLAQTRRTLQEALPPDIPLAPLRFKTAEEAIDSISKLNSTQLTALQEGMSASEMATLTRLIQRKGKMSAGGLTALSKAVEKVAPPAAAKPPSPKALNEIRTRVARDEARILDRPAEFRKDLQTRQVTDADLPPAVEVEIRDAGGVVIKKRVPFREVATADPTFRRHHTRVGRRLKREAGARGARGMVTQEEMAAGLGSEMEFALQDPGILAKIKRNPWITADIGIGAGLIVPPVAGTLLGGFQQSITGENIYRPEQSQSYLLEQHQLMQQQQAQQQHQVMQLQKLMAQNMGRLASVAPQIYNQVLAGQQIPQGGVVIGGQPRTDLMEQMAYDMSTGGYPTQSGQEALLQSFAK